MPNETTRRSILATFSSLGLSTTLLPGALWAKVQASAASEVTLDMMRETAKLAGLDFTDEELELMTDEVNKNYGRYREIRSVTLDNAVPPPLYFDPLVPGIDVDRTPRGFRPSPPPDVNRPSNLEDVAFWPVSHLARLVETRQVSSVELTEMFLSRLERLNPVLNCVVNLTPETCASPGPSRG